VILVVGATGQLGGMITRMLLDQGRPVRVVVRSGSAGEEMSAAGAEPVIADVKDSGSLKAACSGVDVVVTTANSAQRGGDDTVDSVDRDGNRNLVEAAAASGVRRFVFTSALGADPASPVPFLQAKGQAEERVRDSGMDWTVLEPNMFMDVWIPAVVGGPALSGQLVTLVGAGQRRHSMIAARDVAAFAVAALDHPAANNSTLVLGGPAPISWRDVVAAFGRDLGRDVPVQTVTPGTAIPGFPDVMNMLVAAMDTYDSPIDMAECYATYGVTPTSLDDFVRDFVRSGSLPPEHDDARRH
jgi:uncharacterized protein YbjT (DUF2867 family)